MQFSAFETHAVASGATGTVTPEAPNGPYESDIAQINRAAWHVRTARNTPATPGAFVAFWRRAVDGTTMPFGDDDLAAGLLVFVEPHNRRGVFRHTSAHLVELGITCGRRPGKRGFRVYPSWCPGLNTRAEDTQRSQALAFREC